MINTSEEVEQQSLPRALPIFSRFPELKKILICWALSRLVLTIAAGASRIFFEIQKGHFGNPFIDAWAIWDSGWYLNIAENGYSGHTSERGQASYAFFPLYAWLIRGVGFVLQNDVIAGIVISNIAFIVACVAFYRWARLEHDDATSETMLITLVMFPASFIFTAVMTDRWCAGAVVYGVGPAGGLDAAEDQRWARESAGCVGEQRGDTARAAGLAGGEGGLFRRRGG